MKSLSYFLNVAFLSTYPPRECGIATFTQDLVRELKKKKFLRTGVVAVSDRPYRYGDEVWHEVAQPERSSYLDAAEWINRSDIQVLMVEHEYGIYGGVAGSYLLDLLDRVCKPVVATLHTVRPAPDDRQREILKALCQKSAKIVTMASNSRRILQEQYGAAPEKIVVIPHGVPRYDLPSREELKEQMGLQGRAVVSTFGLIGPGKGLEYGVEAIAKVAKTHPDVLYLILGQTHPVILRQSGEAYREELQQLVRAWHLQDNVRFVNRYLTKEELVRYLRLSDIYMTPYLGRDQAVSGTLAYAAGYGKAIVSTPYLYAQEMLADGRGLLAEFKDAGSLARCIDFILTHPEEKAAMERKTMAFGQPMMWDKVASAYIRTLFEAYRAFRVGEEVSNG